MRRTPPLPGPLAAEDAAEAHYSAQGYAVERVGALKLGYDLRCTGPNSELRFESWIAH